jgi:hypothetical protein
MDVSRAAQGEAKEEWNFTNPLAKVLADRTPLGGWAATGRPGGNLSEFVGLVEAVLNRNAEIESKRGQVPREVIDYVGQHLTDLLVMLEMFGAATAVGRECALGLAGDWQFSGVELLSAAAILVGTGGCVEGAMGVLVGAEDCPQE